MFLKEFSSFSPRNYGFGFCKSLCTILILLNMIYEDANLFCFSFSFPSPLHTCVSTNSHIQTVCTLPIFITDHIIRLQHTVTAEIFHAASQLKGDYFILSNDRSGKGDIYRKCMWPC